MDIITGKEEKIYFQNLDESTLLSIWTELSFVVLMCIVINVLNSFFFFLRCTDFNEVWIEHIKHHTTCVQKYDSVFCYVALTETNWSKQGLNLAVFFYTKQNKIIPRDIERETTSGNWL